METLQAKVVSVHVGSLDEHGKEERRSINVEFDGVVGDRHQSFTRSCFSGDKQAKGTLRRNERQWSAISVEELAEITAAMDLSEPLSAADVGANLCLQGISELSRLPMGSLLEFPSGAVLMVSEYNPPCRDKGAQLAGKYTTRSGRALSDTHFPKAAKLNRGLVGVVEVPGAITPGDDVLITVYRHPSWLERSS
ncbi:MAG TPA: hypothetical protein PKH39_02080 [Woeseiaceae bacterium]|nr:hypothetical protein [Woeseiaceae bacterium]